MAVYVGYGDGALAVLTTEGERVGDVPLGGHPESFHLDGGRVYVNVPSRREIAVVDADKLKVVEAWPVSAAAANYPMALDAAHHRLFVATRRPPRLLVYDTGTGRQVATTEAGGDSDDIFYDGAGGRVYASFGEGALFNYEQLDPDRYRLAGKVPTADGARTAFFSPELRRLFVAAPPAQTARHRSSCVRRVRRSCGAPRPEPAPGREPETVSVAMILLLHVADALLDLGLTILLGVAAALLVSLIGRARTKAG
jgi:hypothetical protein